MKPFTLLLALVGTIVSACANTSRPLAESHRRALADSVLTVFDSIAAIHRTQPDTALLRRLHPPGDSVQYVEGQRIETLSGDSLFRRVRALHVPVHSMTQRFFSRVALVIDVDHAVITALETVDWRDGVGAHRYEGVLTVALARGDGRWIVRAYRGT